MPRTKTLMWRDVEDICVAAAPRQLAHNLGESCHLPRPGTMRPTRTEGLHGGEHVARNSRPDRCSHSGVNVKRPPSGRWPFFWHSSEYLSQIEQALAGAHRSAPVGFFQVRLPRAQTLSMRFTLLLLAQVTKPLQEIYGELAVDPACSLCQPSACLFTNQSTPWQIPKQEGFCKSLAKQETPGLSTGARSAKLQARRAAAVVLLIRTASGDFKNNQQSKCFKCFKCFKCQRLRCDS